MKTYILYWKDGKMEKVKGNNPADAMNQAGYGSGALRALDFYASGKTTYKWNKLTHKWEYEN